MSSEGTDPLDQDIDQFVDVVGRLPSATDLAELAGDLVSGVRALDEAASVSVYRFTGDGDRFEPIEHHGPHEAEPIDDTEITTTFRRNEPARLEQSTIWPSATDGECFVLPIAARAVLVVAPAAAFEPAREYLDALVTCGTLRLDQLGSEQTVRSQEETVNELAADLDVVRSFSRCYRAICLEALSGGTVPSIRSMACDRLVELDWVSFAWIGTVSPSDRAIEPNAWAGDGRGYLDRLSFSLDAGRGTEPAIRAVQSNSAIRIEDLQHNPTGTAEWRRAATARGFTSVVAVPITHQGVTVGVLAIYADTARTFEALTADSIVELGALIGAAIASTHRRACILTDQRKLLEFEVTDPGCVLLCFARDTGCSFRVEGVVPRQEEGEEAAVFVTIDSEASDQLMDTLQASLVVREPTRVEGETETRVRFVLTEPFIGSYAANFGFKLQKVTATEGGVHAVVACPPTMSTAYVVTVFSNVFTDSTLTAVSPDRRLSAAAAMSEGVFDSMTDRQREALETAYNHGFFQWPRESTGEDVAAEMGVSSSTFHRHLRLAMEHLLSAVISTDAPARDP